MKKLTIIILSITLFNQISFAQNWTWPGNFGTNIAFDYLGTTDPMSLGFRTNTIERMQIFEPLTPAFNTGFVGIGDYTVFNPQANVHVHNSVNNDFVSFKVSSGNTNFTRNDGFSFGIAGGLNNIAQIIQHENFPIDIRTHDILSRININFTSTVFGAPPPVPITRIGIPEDGVDFTALSILHLGFSPMWGGASTLGGYRLWMDIGTLSAGLSEQMYVGLLESDTADQFEIWNDHMDAVINWGDNVNPIDGANNLRFIFTSSEPAAATANQTYGLEVGRFTPIGRFGIGNFASVIDGSGSGILPYRKLEIYDEGLDALLNAPAPQLRLTFAPGQTVLNGIWTDFQTTSTGNLFINPSSSLSGTPVNGFVGINTSSPTNTLEINSNSTYTFGVIGNSGLTFSDLRSGSGTSAGNGKVLTVDNNGVVILVPDNDGGSITACSVPGLTTNYITKATASTQICRSQVYDDGTSVGVGVGASPNTAMKLHMQGDIYVQHNMGAGTPKGGDIFMNDASGNVERILSMYGTGGFGAISLGHFAGNSQTLGSGSGSIANSVFVGREAGRNIASNSSHNTLIGSEAGEALSASTGNSNTFMGSTAGWNFADGEKNVIIGSAAGNGLSADLLTDGDFNDSLGVQTHPSIDTKGIRYLEFIPLLMQGFKEQKSQVDDLQQQINNLTQQLNNCCAQPLINDGDTQNNKASLVLSNKETIILNQNAPNPFKDKTEIGYNIPESVGDAVILFYDQSGKVLQKFEINHRGSGSLTVYGEDLSSGAYTYSLIIDGKNHQTKRMVKQ